MTTNAARCRRVLLMVLFLSDKENALNHLGNLFPLFRNGLETGLSLDKHLLIPKHQLGNIYMVQEMTSPLSH
jgi:hypothetical protein